MKIVFAKSKYDCFMLGHQHYFMLQASAHDVDIMSEVQDRARTARLCYC
jgi:hypothetical protein